MDHGHHRHHGTTLTQDIPILVMDIPMERTEITITTVTTTVDKSIHLQQTATM
jgi:hypothetical protein